MRDSLMLSGLTVGEKQHPRLGGCVRVFFQLFDWNRRLSCKKRIFSQQKQLPSERAIRRAFAKYKDGSGEAFLSTVDSKEVLFLTNGEEEDNLQLKLLERCSKEEIIEGEEGMRKSNDEVHEAQAISAGFCSESEGLQESVLSVKSPGVIGKLMGLDSLPSPACTPPCAIKQKGSPTPPAPVDLPTVTPPPHDHYMPKVAPRAFEHGLPAEELNALLDELNGTMCTILSALPPHLGISSRNRPSTPSTCPSNSTMCIVYPPPSSAPARICTEAKVNTTAVGASSQSSTTLPPLTHDVNSSSTATIIQAHDANLANRSSSIASNSPTRTSQSSTNACRVLIGSAPKADEESAKRSQHKEGTQSRDHAVSELEQELMRCARTGQREGGAIKSERRTKGKRISGVDGKRLSEKSVGAGFHGTSMDMIKGQCSPQELQDAGRTTSKPAVRRKKVDTPMHHIRLQEGEVRVSPIDQAVPHRKPEDMGVRGSPDDNPSCSLAGRSTAAAEKLDCKHDGCLSSSKFAIQYNVAFFDEYHKSRAKLGSAGKHKNSNDSDVEKANKCEVTREAVDDHHQSRSLRCGNAATILSTGATEEEPSFIQVLIKRRAAREATATAALQAAGILPTASPVDHIHFPAVACSSSVESLQSIISSCSTEMDNDPNRREKLSAGRSEAGGGDFIQVLRPITYSMDTSGVSAACSMSGSRNCDFPTPPAGMIRDSNYNNGGVGWCRVTPGMDNVDRVLHRGMCMGASAMACTKEKSAEEAGVQVEICGTHAGSGKSTTAAILQDVLSALNGNALSTPVSPCRRRRQHMLSDDDGSTPSTADGNDTESTSESGGCWAAASQPSPVSVLISPFEDDVSPARDDTCWIQSEDDYVAALLAATSENGKTILPPAELFGKLEERVIAAWPDSEVPPTRGYRKLVFDCVCEALGQAVAVKGNRRWRARVLFEEMCRWRKGAYDIVLDDLVEVEMRKPCNGWVAFEVQTREIAARLERTILGLLVEELVCDLVLSEL